MANKVVINQKQHLVYTLIKEYKESHDGNSPSYRKISQILTYRGHPMSDTTVMECIRAMPELVLRGPGGLEILCGVWSVKDEPEISKRQS